MHTITMSSREFTQDVVRARRAAAKGPVIITSRGRPAHVLLTFDHYDSLRSPAPSIVALLAMPGTDEFEFERPRMGGTSRPVDLG